MFFNEPTKEHYLIEISRKAKIAHTSVKNHLETLKRQGVIKETAEKKGERDFPLYKADTENKEYTLYKKTDNFIRLKTSGLVGYLKDSLMPSVIIVFGSYARGEDTEDSDIDIFVMCKEEPLRLEKFEKLLNRKIQLHFKKDLKDYPPELKNNIINGTVLDGYLEVF